MSTNLDGECFWVLHKSSGGLNVNNSINNSRSLVDWLVQTSVRKIFSCWT
ncbi:hypothetical protein AHF37_11651 [Paragonimus kellicotti]|nr:hypothetical protein AHF37_11651 [Paragonimus kellicotti]